MTNNELRTKMQNEAVVALLHKRRLIVEWGTGVGKSRVAIRSALEIARTGRRSILLLVTEEVHKKNWEREFTDALGEQLGRRLFSILTVECYASLPKYKNTVWDFIIADEAHHLRSDLRTKILASMRADYVLCLSATLSDKFDAFNLELILRETFGEFERMKFGIQDAIDAGVLAEPKIYVHVLTLDDVPDTVQAKVSWGWAKAQRKLECGYETYQEIMANIGRYPAMNLTVNCTAKQGYDIMTYHYEWNRKLFADADRKSQDVFLANEERQKALKKATFAKNKMLNAGNMRKTFIGECKTSYAHRLLERMNGRKYVCFCSSISQGERLNADNIIHSKKKGKNEIIDAFNDGRISSLFAVNMIQEGANLRGIQEGLVIQLDGKQRPFVQKIGRTLRSSCPVQHIILMNGTRDAKYFKNVFPEMNPNYITYIDGKTGKVIPVKKQN